MRIRCISLSPSRQTSIHNGDEKLKIETQDLASSALRVAVCVHAVSPRLLRDAGHAARFKAKHINSVSLSLSSLGEAPRTPSVSFSLLGCNNQRQEIDSAASLRQRCELFHWKMLVMLLA
jgi:hypothetical protein